MWRVTQRAHAIAARDLAVCTVPVCFLWENYSPPTHDRMHRYGELLCYCEQHALQASGVHLAALRKEAAANATFGLPPIKRVQNILQQRQ